LGSVAQFAKPCSPLFGEGEVEFLDAASSRFHFFASRLNYSRCVRVSVVKDETVESLVSEPGGASRQLGRSSFAVCRQCSI